MSSCIFSPASSLVGSSLGGSSLGGSTLGFGFVAIGLQKVSKFYKKEESKSNN